MVLTQPDLIKKIKAVNRIYRDLDADITRFRQASGLICPSDCGECCMKPDLNATVLEFLPAAHHLFVTGTYNSVIEKLDYLADPVCVFYNPFARRGMCTNYPGRGLVCRLFGFSVRNDKNGNRSLITCKKIKSTLKPGQIEPFLDQAPVTSSYSMRLYGIDPELSTQYFPVNKAIKRALELVVFYNDYNSKESA